MLWGNERFWEEVIAYFPLIRHEPHRKTKKKYGREKLRGGGINRWTDIRIHRQRGDLISLLFFILKARKVG
jgi:hypothetical protein